MNSKLLNLTEFLLVSEHLYLILQFRDYEENYSSDVPKVKYLTTRKILKLNSIIISTALQNLENQIRTAF